MLRHWRHYDSLVDNITFFAVTYFRDDGKHGGDVDGIRLMFGTLDYAEMVEFKARSLGHCVILRHDPDVRFGNNHLGSMWALEVR